MQSDRNEALLPLQPPKRLESIAASNRQAKLGRPADGGHYPNPYLLTPARTARCCGHDLDLSEAVDVDQSHAVANGEFDGASRLARAVEKYPRGRNAEPYCQPEFEMRNDLRECAELVQHRDDAGQRIGLIRVRDFNVRMQAGEAFVKTAIVRFEAPSIDNQKRSSKLIGEVDRVAFADYETAGRRYRSAPRFRANALLLVQCDSSNLVPPMLAVDQKTLCAGTKG